MHCELHALFSLYTLSFTHTNIFINSYVIITTCALFTDWLFPIDTVLVHSLLQEVNGAQWKLLGMSLAIPWNKLDDIENEASFPGDIAKKEEVIRLWMSQEPTWTVLVDALSQSAYGWSQNSSQISQEHSKYLNYSYRIYLIKRPSRLNAHDKSSVFVNNARHK